MFARLRNGSPEDEFSGFKNTEYNRTVFNYMEQYYSKNTTSHQPNVWLYSPEPYFRIIPHFLWRATRVLLNSALFSHLYWCMMQWIDLNWFKFKLPAKRCSSPISQIKLPESFAIRKWLICKAIQFFNHKSFLLFLI